MANIQAQMTNVKADLDYNAFDLSERHLFSAKVGQLLPVYNKQVVPGDYFEIDTAAFLRTMPLQTAAYVRMRQHVDFFFVPYKQLWSKFPEMKYQRKDPVHAISGLISLGVTSPWVTMRNLIDAVVQCDSIPGQDEFGFYLNATSVKLCDLLGYGNYNGLLDYQYQPAGTGVYIPHATIPMADIPDAIGLKHVTIWPWLAYQKIWSDYYRNPYFDANVNPLIFNVDDISAATAADGEIGLSRLRSSGITRIRYRQWKKDYFTGVFPDRQFGDISQVMGGQLSLNMATPATANGQFNLVGSATLGSTVVPTYINSASPQNALSLGSGGLSALDIRRAELLQIWKEKVLRAGYHTEKQQLAHFGVRSETMDDYHVEYLGGTSELVNINEVVCTSALNSVIGELGGKGQSLNTGQKIRYKVKDDGLIMAIFSILPESEYNSFGISHDHMRIDPFDYFTPAFQNIGFEALSRIELDGVQDPSNANLIFGYAPPYYDMKMGIDRVHGEFSTQFLEDNVWGQTYVHQTTPGSLSQFDTARNDTYFSLTLPFFYVNPRVMDSIFHKAADDNPDSDQFVVNCFFDIKAVRPMSVLGLPNF